MRVVAVLFGFILLLLIGLSIYVSSSRERLLSFLNAKLKETILGELKIDNADISIWQTFPKIGITLSNVTISDSFYHKPFLRAKSITAKVGFGGLIGKKLTINSVKLEGALIFTFTDRKGYTNSYVLKPQNKPKRQSKKPVLVSNLELENVVVVSEDLIKNKRYVLIINDAEADIALHGSKYNIKLDEDILVGGLGFNLEKGYWMRNQRVQTKWKLEFDTSGNILSFNDTKVEIQDQPFIINGAFFLNQPAHFTINASTKNIDFAAAMAILKPTTSEKIKKLNLSEPLDVSVMLDGSMAYKTIPLIKANFSTQENNINTPVVNFSNCNFSGTFINQVNANLPRTDDNSQVMINSFTSNWGDINLRAQNIVVTNLLKPVLQFQFSSQCTLPQLDEQLSSETLHFLDGNAKLYLAYKGPLITDPSLLDRLNAKIQIQNGKIVYEPRNLTFSECNGIIDITDNNLLTKNLECNLNTNHFVINITGQNLNRFSTNEPGKATLNCDVYSPALDLSDFRTLFGQKTNKTVKKRREALSGTANSIDNAIENGNLYINVKAQQLSLDNFKANNVIANVFFNAEYWEIQHASLQHADGNFNIAAKINEVNDARHHVNAQVSLEQVNVKKLFYAFDNFGQTGITYRNLKGIIDAKANIAADLNSTGKFLTSSMNGNINFSLKNAALINLEALINIQQFILKNRNLNNVEFATVQNNFKIQNGDIYISRMPIQSSAITMYIEGVYSFANRTDISIQIPFSTLKNKPEDYKTIDKEKAEKPGASIYLRAKDKNGQVKIGLDVFHKKRKKKDE